MSDSDKKNASIKSIVNVRKSELIKKGYKDFNEWKMDEENVYIGRDMSFYVDGATGSIWGNPYPVAKTQKKCKSNRTMYTLDESLRKYRQHIESTPELLAKLPDLQDKVLGCWCKPNRCHGDVLKELVEKYC